jgi:hypothetical protein
MRWRRVRMTGDARLRLWSRDEHALRPRPSPFTMALHAVERRARGIRGAHVAYVIEPEVGGRSAPGRPRDGLRIPSIVTVGARRRRRKHRGGVAGADPRVASSTRREELRMPGVRECGVVRAARRAAVRESRRRRERDDQHERDVAWSRRSRHGFIPGSRPVVHTRRSSARRWLQFTVVDWVSSAMCRYRPTCPETRTSGRSCHPPSTDAPTT